MKSKQEMIDDIMDNFDFNKVAKCMKALNWKWHDVDGSVNVPEEHHIRKEARKLMNSVKDVCHHRTFITGTGGFYVQCWYNQHPSAYSTDKGKLESMELTFVLAEWDA